MDFNQTVNVKAFQFKQYRQTECAVFWLKTVNCLRPFDVTFVVYSWQKEAVVKLIFVSICRLLYVLCKETKEI